MKQLKASDIKSIREELLKIQNYKCAICGKDIKNEDGVSLDHQHKLNKNQKIGEDGAGLIRGVLCRDCNVLEGKIWNNGNRYKQFKTVLERITWLSNLITYYAHQNYDMIHPSEKPSEPLLSKRQFAKLAKVYKLKYPKRKELVFPKSSKVTTKLLKLFEEFEISPWTK